MGVIGDLFVRLGLKTEDYKKGVKDAKKENASFKQGLQSVKASAVAVWAAIGASVVKVAKDVINGTNRIGDAWAKTTATMKAKWDLFIQSLSNFDFTNFSQRLKGTAEAAKALADAQDLEFEVVNSARLQRALMSDELEQLRIAMMDTTKSYDDRLKAANNYLTKIKPIYEQEIKMAETLLDATSNKWLAGTNLAGSATAKEDLAKFLVDYGNLNDTALANIVKDYVALKNKYNSLETAASFSNIFNRNAADTALQVQKEKKELKAQLEKAEENLRKFGAERGYKNFLGDLGVIYENWRGDKDTTPLVDAMVRAAEASSAMASENRKINNLINTLQAAINAQDKAESAEQKKLQKKVYDFQYKNALKYLKEDIDFQEAKKALNEELFGDIDTEFDMSYVENEMDAFIDEFKKDVEEIQALNETLSYAIADSLAGGMQELMNTLFDMENADPSQILSALVQPFADSAIQLGGMLIAQGLAIEAFKTSLASLNGFAAVAAGTALVAAGAAMKAGIQALANRGANATAATTAYDSSDYTGGYETFESNITVEVVGKISGSDIILAGSKQLNKWGR